MCKNKVLRVRVSSSQYERIKNNVEVFGKKSVSDYCREILLNDPPSLLRLSSIEKMVKKIEKRLSE